MSQVLSVMCFFWGGGCSDGQTLAFVFAHHRVTRNQLTLIMLCSQKKKWKIMPKSSGIFVSGSCQKKKFLVRSWRPLTSSSAQPPVALSSVQISHQGTGAGPSTSGGGCGTERDAVAVESLEPLWCVG